MENKVYSFSTNDAVKHGVDSAILLHNIRYWLDYARAHEEMKEDGYYWMFATAASMHKLFPFWTINKIRKMIKELEKSGVLISGEYNKSSWNRTKWYTMPEFADVANPLPPESETATSTCSETATSLYDQYDDSNIVDHPDPLKQNIDYKLVETIYNESLPNAGNIARLTDTRKKLVKEFFDNFDLNSVKFKSYLEYIAASIDCQWMFEKRPMNDGTGRSWGKQKFEYFISEKCYLNIKENL